MSYNPPPSPPLPTFAIKDLCGPSNPPGLVSISKRRYDATLKSTPDAALLYLDDDDGELITVGSGFELGQRLEEPVPKYIRELRDPADGKLVHVFDINHSLASLIEWRDHEAYSSKRLSSLSSPLRSSSSDHLILPDSSCSSVEASPVVYPDLHEFHEESTNLRKPENTVTQNLTFTQKETLEEPLDLLSGIEEHLSGLANVLQIAANTLQKAANKTKETDTSVIEDILKGVKGILTEVGSFGVEAFRELGAEIETVAREHSAPTTAPSDEAEIAAQVAQEAREEYNARAVRKEGQSPEALEASTYYNVEDTAAKVKFTLPEAAKEEEEVVPLEPTRPIPIHAQSACPEDSRKVNVLEQTPTGKYQHPSFLDDSSEDAEFTARYPPLNYIRRTRSTSDRPFARAGSYTDDVGAEKALAQKRWQVKLDAGKLSSSPTSTETSPFLAQSPFASPRPAVVNEMTTTPGKTDIEDKVESADVAQKPLPGAWPDAKNDTVSSQALPRESSGDFFNRMVGRRYPSRYRASCLESGLHRANTTASSNPASRLNGPFDPGFPYDTSSSSSHRPGPSRSHRIHRQLTGSSHNRYSLPVTAPSNNDKATSSASESDSFMPTSRNINTPSENTSQRSAESLRSQFESHRAVKHHRSVPQFHGSSALPYQIMRPRPIGHHSQRHAQRSATDFLSGPPMHMPPPLPFTTRPSFAPRPAPPSIWAPWQSSPPTQPLTDGGTNVSSLSEYTINNDASSPVSSQSTSGRDAEIPSNEPPFPSAQPQRPPSPSAYRYPTPPRPAPRPPFPSLHSPFALSHPPVSIPTFWPPPPPLEPMGIEPVKDKIDECVEQLKMCGFGVDDDNLKNRLHVYAVAADGDITEAVEMIEQDRRMTAPGRFD